MLPTGSGPNHMFPWGQFPMTGNPGVAAFPPLPVAIDPNMTGRRAFAFNDNFLSRWRRSFLHYDYFLCGNRRLHIDDSWRWRRLSNDHGGSVRPSLDFLHDTARRPSAGQARLDQAPHPLHG